jgi:pimeloyl-ACP methyl ester carboxylesterase
MILLYIFLAIIFLAAVYFLFCYYLSSTIIFLNRQPVPKNPKDYGLDFENIEFKASDGVSIKGWLIPGSLPKLIVMTHVGGLTKYGSTASYRSFSKLYNKEIEFVETAKHLHNKGYWVLMFDFRNHGESGRSPNSGKAGVGLEEYKDVVAAMNFIKSRDELNGFKIGFVSFCMGANSTIIAMSKEPDAFKEVKCLMAVQPISMEVFVRRYTKILFKSLGFKIIFPMVKRFVNLRSAHLLEKMSPYEYVKDLKVPVLYVQARNDPWTELSDIQSFYENTPGPKEFYWIENTKHRFESYSYFQKNPEKMLEWLESRL